MAELTGQEYADLRRVIDAFKNGKKINQLQLPITDDLAQLSVEVVENGESKRMSLGQVAQNTADIRYLKSVESGSASLFNTDPAWEVEDFATLQSWIDADNHAHDTINDRDIHDFDVYLVTSENKEYFFDAGAWIPLAQAPSAPVEMSKVVAIDDTTLVVKLSAIPTEEVTANSFAVYDAATGDAIAVSAVAGGGVDYVLTVAKSKGVGISFNGGAAVLISDDENSMVKVYTPDNTTINVVLKRAPTTVLTTGSFSAFDTTNGNTVAISAISPTTGLVTDYTLTVASNTNVGLTYLGD
ncbi:hypothetical protein AGMMS49965_20150 [Bacteroidia bacterium]|nr:hypothetical protein AGMMS49965_20150 [Bacteroidia bacterium]